MPRCWARGTTTGLRALLLQAAAVQLNSNHLDSGVVIQDTRMSLSSAIGDAFVRLR